MVDRTGREPEDGPRFRVLRGGQNDTDRDSRDGREGVDGRTGRDGRDDEPGRDAAGRLLETGRTDRGAAGPEAGRDRGPADPFQPDAIDENVRRDERLQYDVGPDQDPVLSERDGLDEAADLRGQAASLRTDAGDRLSEGRYDDARYYDADAEAAQATDPATRSAAIADKNYFRTSGDINRSVADAEDDRAGALEADARAAASASYQPDEGRANWRVDDPQNSSYRSGVAVERNSPLPGAHGATSAQNTARASRGSRKGPQTPRKNQGPREK